MKKLLFLSIIGIILLPLVLANQGHMRLLAVTELANGSMRGGIADLYLEIKPGSGRVFLETFPVTRTDTQISTRFAKTIACDFIEEDCSRYDFFYTINADSSIVAGPSAGASIAALTASMLKGLKIDEDIVATGTINSGGLVGPVGGLKAKIEAASKAGLKKALIPVGEPIKEEGNETKTISARNFSEQAGIEIIEVSTLADVIGQFTGKNLGKEYPPISIDNKYSSVMESLAVQLCERSNFLLEELDKIKSDVNITKKLEEALNNTQRGKNAFENGEFYSSASFCFGANVELGNLILFKQNATKEELIERLALLKEEIMRFENETEAKERNTITSLEAYMAVKERLDEANSLADRTLESLVSNQSMSAHSSRRNLAYANERLNSAYSWSKFFGNSGKKFNLDKEMVRQSCQNKISEVEERLQYVEFYLSGTMSSIKLELSDAYKDLGSGNYELCLFKASKLKADSDVVLSVFGVDESNYDSLLDRKITIAEEVLAKEASKGIFPVLGYSYYEYSKSLKNSNKMSALLYSEYASELGNLDIYFREESNNFSIPIDKSLLLVFLSGAAIGFIASLLIRKKIRK